MVTALGAGGQAGALLMATVALWPMGAALEALLTMAVPVLPGTTRAVQARGATTVALVLRAMVMVAAQVQEAMVTVMAFAALAHPEEEARLPETWNHFPVSGRYMWL